MSSSTLFRHNYSRNIYEILIFFTKLFLCKIQKCRFAYSLHPFYFYDCIVLRKTALNQRVSVQSLCIITIFRIRISFDFHLVGCRYSIDIYTWLIFHVSIFDYWTSILWKGFPKTAIVEILTSVRSFQQKLALHLHIFVL